MIIRQCVDFVMNFQYLLLYRLVSGQKLRFVERFERPQNDL